MAISGGDGSIILTTKVDHTGLKSGMASIKSGVSALSKSITKIGAAIGVAFGVGALIKFGKQAVQLASDLQEVQNVVDVAFGDMAYRMERFADTAIETFGISKLTAKQTGSSYMAMAKGMQIADDAAADMALTLTGLSADMASFYNIRQEEARTALSAVFTGETETLKRYGILITEVNLQEYARQQGITKSINAMTQQEKVMLRYQYILQATQLAQGDFARTQDSWANQTRILSERWKEMATIFGEAFMSIGLIVLPVVNSIIAGLTKVAQVAKIAAQWIYKIFTGKELKITQSQGEALSGVGVGANEAADGMEALGDAAKGAGKEAKKSLAAFDELNILSENSSAGGGGGGGAGGGVGAAGGFGDVSLEDSQLFETEQYDELIEKLQGVLVLVGLIGTSLLAWKITDLLLTDAAKFLGQLKIISGWIMIIAGSILLLKGYSEAWANGIDWGNLATAISGLALFISGIAIAISPLAAAFVAVGGGIALVILGIRDIIENGATLQNILTIITGALVTTVGVLSIIGKASVFGSLLPVLATLAGVFITLKGVADALMNGLDWESFATILAGLAITITAIALSSDAIYASISLVIGGIVMLVVGITDLVTNGYSMQAVIMVVIGVLSVLIGVIWAFNAALLANPIVLIVEAIILLAGTFVILWNECEGFRNFWINLWDKVKSVASTVWDAIKGFFISAWDAIKSVWEQVQPYFSAIWEGIKAVFSVVVDVLSGYFKVAWESIKFIWDAVVSYFQMIWDNIKIIFSVVKDVLSGDFSSAWEGIKAIWDNVTTWFGGVWDGIKAVFATIDVWFEEIFGDAWTKIKNVFASWGEFFGSLWDTVKQKFTDFGTKMGDAIGDAVKSGINSVLAFIERTINKAINLINGAINLINKIPGVNVGKISPISLPRLAQGTVIPPNKEFLAVLGDQKQGVNIEAPLQTIVDAFNIALAQNGGAGGRNTEVVLEIDGREFGRAVVEQGNRENRRIGTRLVTV